MFELAILDCDGVLVDSERITCEVTAACLTEIGLPKTTEQCMRDYIGRWWPDSVEMIEAELGRPLPAGFTERYRERQNQALARGVDPIPGVVDALDSISTPTCVASNGTPQKMAITLAGAGLIDRFEGRIFSATEVARGKPAPDLFIHAATSMGVEPSRCAVVEDSALGVVAARAAGMAAFGYAAHTDAAALADAGATTFASMAELPGLLEPPH